MIEEGKEELLVGEDPVRTDANFLSDKKQPPKMIVEEVEEGKMHELDMNAKDFKDDKDFNPIMPSTLGEGMVPMLTTEDPAL